MIPFRAHDIPNEMREAHPEARSRLLALNLSSMQVSCRGGNRQAQPEAPRRVCGLEPHESPLDLLARLRRDPGDARREDRARVRDRGCPGQRPEVRGPPPGALERGWIRTSD